VTDGWLLDTNVISELFKGPRADRAVREWVDQADEDTLYLSVITLGEIAKGIGLAEERGRDMRRQRDFLDRILPETFGNRILPFSTAAAVIWGRILQRLWGNRQQERLLAIDAQIAATAEAASLGLCSRNTRDFDRLGIREVFNPFGGP
jgi:predicted nucleic acid-binding protein